MEREPSQLAHSQRLSVASRIQNDRSPLTTEFNLDNPASSTLETSLKHEGSIGGAWGKIVDALTRITSNSGRWSRTNSVATRGHGENIDSSISQESGGSLTSPKADRNEALGMVSPPNLSVMQFLSALVAPVQSLTLQTPPRSGVLPIPPASLVDLAKYNDTKLFFSWHEEARRRYPILALILSCPSIVTTMRFPFHQVLPTICHPILQMSNRIGHFRTRHLTSSFTQV